MGSQKPILAGAKPDLVAVILERSVAQQLALALAWALGSTGGGKSQEKGTLYTGSFKGGDVGGKPVLGAAPQMAAADPAASSAKKGAKKSSTKKSGAKKSTGKK
jgi:hypothetical protein